MKTKKRFLGILLSLVMVLGLLPGMRLTAYATTVTETDVFDLIYNLQDLIDQKAVEGDMQAADALYQAYEALGNAFFMVGRNITPEVEAAYNSALAVYQQYGGGGHTHFWGYQASGASVTATCTGTGICDYKTNGVTLTISAPANLECDGNAKAAAISGEIPGGSGLPDPSNITYNPGGSTAPTEPGDYTASFTWGGANASVNFTLTAPAHTHDFTFSASGATITATCGAANCGLTSNPTLTIVKPTLTTYGETGKSEAATLTGLADFNTATGMSIAATNIKYYSVKEVEIDGHTYKNQGDELVGGAPTTPGEYVAGLTLSNVKTSETETGDVIARVWYTIAPASISSVTVTDITAPVATEALDTAAATSTANVTLGTVTWNPTTTPVAYATQYTATVIATAATNYAFADTATATVNGETATVTKNEDGTLSISYTFEKTALTPVTITPVDKEVAYSADGIAIPVDGMFTITEGAGAATYTVTNGTGEGTFAEGKLTVTKCGTFTVKVSTAATATHAAGAETSATLTVNKVAPTVTAPTAKTLTYTGSAQELINPGSTNDGTIKYAVTTENTAPDAEAYNFDNTSIPAKTDAGTYYVWYKVVGDTNHTDTQAAKVTVTVSKATVTAPTIASKTYTGAAQTADVAASTLYSVTTNNGGTNVGSYNVVLTLTDSANYKWSDSTKAAKTLSFQITKATANTVTVNIEGWTYGEAAKAPTSTATFGTAAYTYAVKGSTQFAAEVPTNAGEYTVKAAVAGTTNYPAGEATKDFTIARAFITPTVSITGWTVGETANTPVVTDNTGNGAVTYTYAAKGSTDFSAAVPTDAGEYTVKAGIAATTNYNAGEATADFTIAKKIPAAGVDFTVEPLQLTYTGVRKELVRQTILTDGLEIEYSFDGASVETGLPMKKASGEYQIYYRVKGNDTYEDLGWTGPMLATIKMYATFRSPDFVLPPFLTEIGEEAFAEDTSLTTMDVGNCAIIDAYAFRDCTNLKRICLPLDCEIDDTAFDGCVALRAIFAPSGGTTAAWCASHDVNFVPISQN